MSDLPHDMELTVVVSDKIQKIYGIQLEAGLAFWLEGRGVKILYDTGPGESLFHNSAVLGLPLTSVDAVVLSHGHLNHVGGLPRLLEVADHTRVYVHPAAFQPKYTLLPQGPRRSNALQNFDPDSIQSQAQLVLTVGPTEIHPGVWLTGSIPRQNEDEDVGGPYFLDSEGQQPDPMLDEQALFFESRGGIVVLMGCGHAGLINTLTYVRQLTGQNRLYGVFGGMHLASVSWERIYWTIEELGDFGLTYICPMHCTGSRATQELEGTYPAYVVLGSVGRRLGF